MLDKVGSAKGVEELRLQLKQQVSPCSDNHMLQHSSAHMYALAATSSDESD